MNINTKKSKNGSKTKVNFDTQAFLDTAGVARTQREFERAEVIFSQGAAAESIMYIQQGSVKISALSASGKEAIIAILGPVTSLAKAAWPVNPCGWAMLPPSPPAPS